MSTKLWVGDKLFVVEEPVREEMDRLKDENRALREAIKDVLGHFRTDAFMECSVAEHCEVRLEQALEGDGKCWNKRTDNTNCAQCVLPSKLHELSLANIAHKQRCEKAEAAIRYAINKTYILKNTPKAVVRCRRDLMKMDTRLNEAMKGEQK